MTAMTAEWPTPQSLREEAKAIVAATPPRDVLLTLITGLFGILGWIIGRLWIIVAETVTLCWVAARVGYWNGAKVPPERRRRRPPQPPRQQ